MAWASCNVISHHVQPNRIEKLTETLTFPFIQVCKLTIEFHLLQHDHITEPFFTSQRSFRFHLDILRNRNLSYRRLAPILTSLGINRSSTETIIQEIRSSGVGNANDVARRGSYCKALCLHSVIHATQIQQETLMTSAFAESASEFESHNYGMVAANESSINHMLKRVRVEEEEEEEENCTICFDQLKVGFEASRMPCSHSFHPHCIQKWLNQSHYCPVCRYEMPTR